MDGKIFMVIMRKIQDAYANKFRLSEGMIETWYECLNDLDANDLHRAVTAHIRESVYPPTVADLRKRCQQMNEERKSYHAELRSSCDTIVALYPYTGEDENTVRETFSRIIRQFDGDKLGRAREMEAGTARYVRKLETEQPERIITLNEFLLREYGGAL